jgi:hypothetical protein
MCCGASDMLHVLEFWKPTRAKAGKVDSPSRIAFFAIPKSHKMSTRSFGRALFSLTARPQFRKCLAWSSDTPLGRLCSKIAAPSVGIFISSLKSSKVKQKSRIQRQVTRLVSSFARRLTIDRSCVGSVDHCFAGYTWNCCWGLISAGYASKKLFHALKLKESLHLESVESREAFRKGDMRVEKVLVDLRSVVPARPLQRFGREKFRIPSTASQCHVL